MESFNWKRTTIYLGLLLGTVVAVAIGLGLGLGLEYRADLTPTTAGNSTISNASDNSNPFIMPDASISAITDSYGNRHLIFQGSDGDLRIIDKYPQDQSWPVETGRIHLPSPTDITVTPRNCTPLATLQIYQPSSSFRVFYITTENRISGVDLYYENASGNPASISKPNESFLVAPNTRALSISPLAPSQGNASFLEALLFYEAPNHSINVLHGSFSPLEYEDWTWENVTDRVLRPVLDNPNTTLNTPLGSSSTKNNSANAMPQIVDIAYYSYKDSNSQICSYTFNWTALGMVN